MRLRGRLTEIETHWALAGRPVRPALYASGGLLLLGLSYLAGRRRAGRRRGRTGNAPPVATEETSYDMVVDQDVLDRLRRPAASVAWCPDQVTYTTEDSAR